METTPAVTSLLNEATLTRVQLQILQIICQSEKLLSANAVAEKLGIRTYDARLAMADDNFNRIYRKICIISSASRLGEVMEALADKAITGKNVAAIRTYLEVHEILWNPMQKHKGTEAPEGNREELTKKIKDLEEHLKAEVRKEYGDRVENVGFEVEENGRVVIDGEKADGNGI